ncbi:MAG: 4-coumarate--CoA ligase family protein [Pyrinomonadaceae bacterium]
MIFRSPLPDVEIPDVPLVPFVLGNAARYADRPALVDGVSGRVTTYAQLERDVRRAAAALARRRLQKGDVVAILSPNLPEYIVAFYAAATLGAIVTPVNPLYTVEEVARQLSDAGAKFVVTIPQLLSTAREAAKGTRVEELFVFGEAEGATPFASLLEEDGEVPEVLIDPREDIVALPYSSGTTGVCKGVMLTHRNLVANLSQIRALHDLSNDTVVCVLPLFHIYGLVAIANLALLSGAKVVMLPRFDFAQLLKVMQEHRVTFAHLVPPIILALTKQPCVADYDLSSLRTIFSGAAPLGSELSRDCEARLGCEVIQGYGMTESSPATHITAPGQGRAGSVGPCVPNMECKLVSVETGEDVVGVGERGEVCVRGPQVMKGYLNCPEATAQTVDAEGWLHTGDVAYADEEGYFYIVDRAKELIKYKAFQVAPAELEALLLTHPSVADAAVVPSPDEEAGEVPKAFVVVREGHGLTEAEVLSFVAAHVAPHKKVRRVEFVSQIPKSPSGKILRRLLVAREREQQKA